MIKSFFSILLIFCISVLYAQSPKKDSIPPPKPIACDCKQAVKLTVVWNTKYGPTIDTKGYGAIQEIPVKDKHSKYYFETEHNSAWYLLKMNAEGELVFDIVPTAPNDDYDFLLFKYNDTGFCRDFLARKLIPVRSNISRVSDEDSGKTGLASNALVEYETRGKGFAYSKSIHVKKGEQYMLVLDNVYDSGKGHTLFFHILKDFNFSGKTFDDDSVPISATISVLGKNGDTITKAVSNKTTGDYDFATPLQIGGQYTLMYYTPNSFFDMKSFNPTTKKKDTVEYKPVILPTLKENKIYKLKNILFYGDSAGFLLQSFPTLEMLYAILIIHNKMTIRIEGHINAPGYSYDINNLSKRRAQAVYDYLVNKGITKERLSTIGFGGKYPICANPANDIQEQQNRRVEIRVLSLGE